MLKEELAKHSHKNWSQWARRLFVKCEENFNGDIVIPKEVAGPMKRIMRTVYTNLPEDEKKVYRDEAKKVMNIFINDINNQRQR